jgi:hypothetical protein
MPKVDFQELSQATVKVGGREQIGLTGARGPQSFPPPPPPPPPPVVPLVIASIISEDWYSSMIAYKVTFTEQPFLTDVPNWTADVPVDPPAAAMKEGFPNSVYLLCNAGDATELAVPVDNTGCVSASGGKVTPGTYPVPFPA